MSQKLISSMRRFTNSTYRCHQYIPSPGFSKQPQRCLSTATESLPRAAQPSIWQSIVPKALRRPKSPTNIPQSRSLKEWNPATFFIVVFLLIGSNAIQMIALRNDFVAFSRKAEAKIGLLKDVIDRVHKGEDVDVEGLLGTGNSEQEREWEEVIREIEEADRNWEASARRRKGRRGQDTETHEADPNDSTNTNLEWSSPTSTEATSSGDHPVSTDGSAEPTLRGRPRGFY